METSKIKIGQICWTDLTVDNADELKEFYKNTLGWTEFAIKMKDENGDEYADYAMMIDEETPAGGICNKRGVNQNIPSQWIMYVKVEDVQDTLNKCLQFGGNVVHTSRKKDGTLNYVIVKDPQGILFGFGNM